MSGPARKRIKRSVGPIDVAKKTASESSRKERSLLANSDENEQITDSFAMSAHELFEVLASHRKFSECMSNPDKPLSEKNMVLLHRAQQVWPRAVSVLGDASAARQWLLQTNRSLGGKSPLTLLDDEIGYTLVMNTLGRIEYGIVS